MRVPEKGVTYKASPRAFLGNYLIGIGVLLLGFLVVSRFDLVFDLTPSGISGILGTAAYVGFVGVALYLFAEFLFEGIARRYVVADHEIVKIDGVVSIRRQTIPYQSVGEVRVTRGPFGRLFNYGTVEIMAFGEGSVDMTHMSNPEEIQRLIQHKVNLMRTMATEKKRSGKGGAKEDKDYDDEE